MAIALRGSNSTVQYTTDCSNCPQDPMTSAEVIDLNLQDLAMSTEEIVPFPEVQRSWFTDGLPGQLFPGTATEEGLLLDFFPIDVIAKQLMIDEPFPFESCNAVGYIDEFGRYTAYPPEYIYNVMEGDRAVTILLRSDDPILVGSYLTYQGFWNNIADWGILPVEQTFTEMVRLMYGVSVSDAIDLSFSIGRTISGDLLEVVEQLNEALTASFDMDFSIVPNEVITETVNYPMSGNERRLGLYQLVYFFGSVFGDDLILLSNRQRFSPDCVGFYFQSQYTFRYLTKIFEQVQVPRPVGTGTIDLMYQ